ncbi:Release factor glutamine methyltransferase [Pirellula sp. SH-Sr6A]|nr:Release factor glutamine methyltransferase [Pirellula sp. SH-Sr6A]
MEIVTSGIPENRQRFELLERIRRKVPVVETMTIIADQTTSWLQVTDPDKLLLTALERGEEGGFEVDPFWAAAWRAAVGMDRFLGQICGEVGETAWRQLSILELGGGSGRAGISAAMRGARVVITDASSTAMLVCRYNAWHMRDRVSVRRLDWRNRNQHLGLFPILVGSDIVYDPKLFPILEPCMRRHLHPHGAVYLSEPQRHTGERFQSWIQSAGWQLLEHYIDLEDGEKQIRIFECRLPK